MGFVQEQRNEISQVPERIHGAGASMDRIGRTVDRVSDMVQAIAVAAEGQPQTPGGLANAMERISATTRAVDESVSHIEQQARNLAQFATSMDGKVRWS